MWKEKLQKLIANGHLRRMPPEVWSSLAEEDCRRLCEEALLNPPRTFASATLEQKNLLRSDLAQGLLPGLKYEDIGELSSDEAKILLSISEENRWTAERKFRQIIRKENDDTQSATPEQLKRIKQLIGERHLRPLSGDTLLKISSLSAKRLIWRGEMNRRNTA